MLLDDIDCAGLVIPSLVEASFAPRLICKEDECVYKEDEGVYTKKPTTSKKKKDVVSCPPSSFTFSRSTGGQKNGQCTTHLSGMMKRLVPSLHCVTQVHLIDQFKNRYH